MIYFDYVVTAYNLEGGDMEIDDSDSSFSKMVCRQTLEMHGIDDLGQTHFNGVALQIYRAVNEWNRLAALQAHSGILWHYHIAQIYEL